MDVGITCLSDFILSEGPQAAVEALSGRARATAVTLNPTVSEPAPDGEGSFQPPDDGGSSPRVFDRPLWGQGRLWVLSQPSYAPDVRLYAGSPYAPRRAGALTERHGTTVRSFIDRSRAAGMEVSFQIGAAAPPGLRDEDRPRLPGGGIAAHPMANTASLASQAVRSYHRAYLTDLLRAYPDLDAVRVDWPEYPCYTIDEAFADFHPDAVAWLGSRAGGSWSTSRREALEREVGNIRRLLLTGLSDDVLAEWIESSGAGAPFVQLFRRYPVLHEWLDAKYRLAEDYLRFLRSVMNDAGAGRTALVPNAFPPPFSILTGLPFAHLHDVAPSVGVKLYTMHWFQIVRFWIDDILARTPGLNEALLAEALLLLFDIGDTLGRPLRPGEVRYPKPDEPHPVDDASQRRKIAQARLECRARVEPIVHGYGPLPDFARRFAAASAAARSPGDPGRVWVNRYGYLSDEKLDVIGGR